MGQVLSLLKKLASGLTRIALLQINVPIAVLIFVFGLSVLLGASLVRRNPDMFGLLKGPDIIREEERSLVAQIGKIIDLPEDEEPTVATVTDPGQLSNQQFFNKAIEGDKLIVYENSGKAILYRPSENRVVEVGSINKNEQQEVVNLDVGSPVRFVILNGTGIAGLTSKMEDSLKQIIPEAEVVSKSNAARSSYKETLLVHSCSLSWTSRCVWAIQPERRRQPMLFCA